MSPLELIAAHPWRRTAFTTYALSLAFFEAVVLDALVRGGAREATIFADVDGVRAALCEEGARRAGRDYEVEPVKVSRGVFHPKVTVLTGEDQSHLLVGSGNLTFGGWGANLEVIEHLHPSFAADAFEDAADFFENVASSNALRHGVTENCGAIADELRTAAATGPTTGNIRLFHSLNGSISDRLIEAADGLGGATRLVIGSPFWDRGAALDRLCAGLGLDEAFVHAHRAGVIEGRAGLNWPISARCRVNAVCVAPLDEGNDRRQLHAKVFEVVCRRGRILLSGSANATSAALGAGNNVEVCVARIQRDHLVGWSLSPGERPEVTDMVDEPGEDPEEVVGILRAILEGDRIAGQILAPRLTGPAHALQLGSEGLSPLAETSIDKDGHFDFDAPGLELQSWKSGRLVVRVRTTDRRFADGFVSVAAFAHMTRRAGAMAPRLLAMLAGTETPADVAAIMSWLHEDPGRLALSPHAITGGRGAHEPAASLDARVPLSELVSTWRPGRSELGPPHDPGAASWTRFMGHVLACLREPRGPFGGTPLGRPDDDDGDDVPSEAAAHDPNVDRAFANFERLFDDWIESAIGLQLGSVLFGMTLYICDRLSPDPRQAQTWLERLVDVLPRNAQTDELREDFAAVILTLLSIETTSQNARRARARLIRFGVDLNCAPPGDHFAYGPRAVFDFHGPFDDLWNDVQSVRTLGEQAATYLGALQTRAASCLCPDLAASCPDEWPVMLEALSSERARGRILSLSTWSEACPRCNSVLPRAELNKLRQHCVATARNCCDRIIVFGGAAIG